MSQYDYYIAGPMRGYNDLNHPAFIHAEKALRNNYGAERIANPARHDLDIGIDGSYVVTNEVLRELMAWDLAALTYSKALALLPGWDRSEGALVEYALAEMLEIPIYYFDESLERLYEFDPNPQPAPSQPSQGRKDRKHIELGFLDPTALLELGKVASHGSRKYSAWNYLGGYDWSLSVNALLRHLLSFWNGEDNDPESGIPHTAHVAWHALALTSFLRRGRGNDDRPS